MLQTTVKNAKEEFDRVFIELGHDSKLEIANKNEVRFFMLDIKNNQYSYYEMFSILHSNLGRYALSRKEFQKIRKQLFLEVFQDFMRLKVLEQGLVER